MQTKEQLAVHIHVVYEKAPVSGWEDIRRTTDVHSLYWIHSGKGIFTSEQDYPVHGGMVAYMPPGMRMFMRSSMEDPLRMTMVLMDCARICFGERSWEEMSVIEAMPIRFLHAFSPSEARQLEHTFNLMRRYGTAGDTMTRVRGRIAMTQLIYELMLKDEGESLVGADSATRAYEKIKQHMEQHFQEDLRVHLLADKYGISVSFLRKLFQRYTNQSPKQYLDRIRMEQAIRLLHFTDEPMKEIAAACGYADEYHFSKMFKLAQGVSPAAYRRTNKKATP